MQLLIQAFSVIVQVRKTSQAGLLLLVERGIIAPSQVEEHVLPVVLEFTTPAAHEDYRTEITQVRSSHSLIISTSLPYLILSPSISIF